MFALLFVTILAGAQACTETNVPSEWTGALKGIFAGTATDVCAGSDLLVNIGVIGKDDTYPIGISGYSNYWVWVAGQETLNVYMQSAQDVVTAGGSEQFIREEFVKLIKKRVGLDNPDTVDPTKKYFLSVVSRQAANAASAQDYDIFVPTWTHLFDYFDSFVECKFNQGQNTDQCDVNAPIEIKLDPGVQSTLSAGTPTSITGCTKAPFCSEGDSGCDQRFCDYKKGFETVRNSGVGLTGVARNYSARADVHTDPLEARAFFEIGLGCSYFFTGNGSSYNGDFYTGMEYITRGDVPMANLNGARFQILPIPSEQEEETERGALQSFLSYFKSLV